MNAGLVWNALNEKGPMTVKDLRKATKLKDKQIYAALGWLSREDKVSTTEVENDLEVSFTVETSFMAFVICCVLCMLSLRLLISLMDAILYHHLICAASYRAAWFCRHSVHGSGSHAHPIKMSP